MKIRITYAQDGIYLPDHQVQKWVDELVGEYQRYQNELFANGTDGKYSISVACELIIDALRVAVRKGRISCEDIIFVYDGQELPIDKDGRIAIWPKGFCDTVETILIQLID